MAVFSVPVTIGVNEQEIAREINKECKERVIDNITDEVKSIMYKDEYHYNRKVLSNEPLRHMVEDEIHDILENKQEDIMKMAAEMLADKLSRTKKVKEMAADVAEKACK